MLYRFFLEVRRADTKTKKMAYFTLARLILEYVCAALDPYLSRDINTLEQIQKRALRFIFRFRGRVSFTDLREKTNIESLKDQRKTVSYGVISDTHCNAPKQHSSKRWALYTIYKN